MLNLHNFGKSSEIPLNFAKWTKQQKARYIKCNGLFLGANHRIRTDGLLITNELLYQLS